MTDPPQRKSILVSEEDFKKPRKSVDAHSGHITPGSFKRIGRLMYRISNQHHEETYRERTIPKIVIFINTVLSPVVGLCISGRGMYDGRISLIGISLRVLYFSLFIVTIYMDTRFERIERWSRLVPKVLGIIFIGVQFIGVLPNYECNINKPMTCI